MFAGEPPYHPPLAMTSIPPPKRLASLGTKLGLATVMVLAVVSTVLYFELTRRELTSLLGAKRTAALMVTDLFAASLGAPVDFGDTDAIVGTAPTVYRPKADATSVLTVLVWPL